MAEKICPQCNGNGKNRSLSYTINPNGATVNSASSGGLTCPAANQITCTGCYGSGIYRSFGV